MNDSLLPPGRPPADPVTDRRTVGVGHRQRRVAARIRRLRLDHAPQPQGPGGGAPGTAGPGRHRLARRGRPPRPGRGLRPLPPQRGATPRSSRSAACSACPSSEEQHGVSLALLPPSSRTTIRSLPFGYDEVDRDELYSAPAVPGDALHRFARHPLGPGRERPAAPRGPPGGVRRRPTATRARTPRATTPTGNRPTRTAPTPRAPGQSERHDTTESAERQASASPDLARGATGGRPLPLATPSPGTRVAPAGP